MKPLLPRLLAILSGLSLLLCMAVAVLWVRSVWASDWVSHASFNADQFRLTRGVSHQGRIVVGQTIIAPKLDIDFPGITTSEKLDLMRVEFRTVCLHYS